MPRSSRSKSHKKSKHSSRDYSDLDEDVKMKESRDNNDGKENGVSFKISKDSLLSGEKRKVGKDLSSVHANEDVSEEYETPTKRRKEKANGGSERWNVDGVEEKSEVVNVDDKKLKLKSKDLLKVDGESKSKTSRKHDVDIDNVVVAEKEERKSGNGNRSEKRSDKESARKEGRQDKENKDRGSERENKIHDSKSEVEVLPKQDDNQSSKRGREHKEWPIDEELRNIELEKELEKRMRRRREGYNDKDIKYKDEGYGEKYRESSRHREDKSREDGDRVSSKSRDVKHRVQSEKDHKHRDDKYHDDSKKDRRREDKHHKDGNRDDRHKDEKHRDKIDKNLKDDRDRNGKNYKDDRQMSKDRRRDNDKDEVTDYKTRSIKDHRSESEKRSMSDDKVDPISVDHNCHKGSPSGKYYPTRDHHRGAKQEETKSRDYVNDERALQSVNFNKDFTSAHGQSGNKEKTTQKDEIFIEESSIERRPRSDNDLSQMDGGNLSVSSPYLRNGRFSSNHKSFPPHQTPLRTGSDSFLGFGSLEDDRSKSNNRNYPNMGRTQTNWNNIPTWPSPFPFPPIFNPIMQPFAPPFFGQPPMNMNRFSGHGIPIPLHGWEANNGVFGDGSHGYGRVDWEHNRTQSNNQMWGDTGVSVDMQSAEDQKDEIMSEESQPEDIENNEESQPKTMDKTSEVMEVIKEDDSLISRVYLSKIDISEDLTQPDLYEQCTKVLDLDQTSIPDEFDYKILFLEEGTEADGALLFDAINNSVFKKAMSLYTKQKEGGEEDGNVILVEEAFEDSSMEVIKKNEEPLIQKLDMDAGVKDSGSCCNDGKVVDKMAGGGCLMVVMPELNEFGSVNLSRIHDHDSPESTH